MDMMYAHLKTGAPLPGSQVVRTVPRGLNSTTPNPITPANVPPIKLEAAAADRITFAGNVVTVAD
jgi:hydroxybutyrate-dimer hydrolase